MRWRKATWAIIVWTALCAYWLYDGVLNTQAESAERYGLFYFLIVGFSILFTWFVGLLRRVEQEGWSYQPPRLHPSRVYPPRSYPQPHQGQQPPSGAPPRPPPAEPGQP